MTTGEGEPFTVPVDAGSIPPELREGERHMVWRWAQRGQKWTKPPYNARTGRLAHVDKPETWSTFNTAVAAYQNGNGWHGIGRALVLEDGYAGLDLDKCVERETGEIAPWARAIIDQMASYTEISPSGTGLRILVRATLPAGGRRRGRLEMYDSGRYLTLTGAHLAGTPATIEERTSELAALHAVTWPPEEKRNGTAPAAARQRQESSDDLVQRARRAKNGAKFADLWDGAWEGGRYESQSQADQALVNLLVWWADGDVGRADQLFRESGLMRPKWDERHYAGGQTYGGRTLEKAAESYRVNPRQGDGGKDRAGAPTADGTPGGYRLTDLGNAERLVAQHSADLRYCHTWGKWLVWTGRQWKIDDTGAVERRAKKTVRSIYTEAANEEDDTARANLAKWAKRSEDRSRIQAMIALAASEPGIPVTPASLDANPWLLNVRNGTIDLRTGELRPHDPDELCTKLAPVDYDPKARCPKWEAFLLHIMGGNAELVAFLQRAIGYILTGLTTEQVLFMFYGTGANGKSTLITVLQELLGDYAAQADFNTFLVHKGETIRNDIARLMGARFVAAVEVDAGRQLSTAALKQLTGGDKVTARFLFREHFEYTPAYKLALVVNHKPEIRETDTAIWRRIRLIPFAVTIPEGERDKRMPEKLRAELTGILTWAVKGCLQWQREGLQTPPAVQNATRDYRADMDALGGFIAENCMIGARMKAPATDLYRTYSAYCEVNGEEALKQTAFGRRLTEHGYERRRDSTTGRFWWWGIGLGSSAPDPLPQEEEGWENADPERSERSEGNFGILPRSTDTSCTFRKNHSDHSDHSAADSAPVDPPPRCHRGGCTTPAVDDGWCAMHAARAELLRLAALPLWAPAMLRPGESAGGTETAWRTFAATATDERLALALTALQREG